MSQLIPAQALENLARIAEAALLTGPDRRVIEASISVLHALVQSAAKPAPTPPPPLGYTEESEARARAGSAAPAPAS